MRPRFRLGIRDWGPVAWQTLHSFAHALPEVLDENLQNTVRTFVYTFGELLPCVKCSQHFLKFLADNEKNDTFKTRQNVVMLLNDAHNAVNARCNKPVFTFEEHCKHYLGDSNPSLPHMYTCTRLLLIVVLCTIVFKMKQNCQKRKVTS